ncbi:DUF4249 domain-containing protein [Pedobacter insulae]|uniref:DUF4249 domain-containing protein n=1 Tax=Pedobacter insulae TaxID=414048 RepID=A0A1I2YL66_9SPHI|nr:DUF4249 domain-containing protein [Pedobacter insulae]SFH26290.1 protein of unknown function [Pedobacter insulae]
MNKLYILFISLAIMLSSCDKVIDLKLKQMEPKIVIESVITDLNTRHTVIISTTTNFESTNGKVPVSKATVVLKAAGGTTINFTEQTPGNYVSSRYRGIPGEKYTLTVTVNDKSYSATSVMPLPVPIKSLDQIEISFLGNVRKVVQLNYNDPAGIVNFYNNRVFINNLKRANYYLESDRFNDGNEVKNTIYIDEPDLVTGDVVRVQMLTIDENVYKFLFSITQISGNGGPPTTPANPNSNFNNGALGYFSASTTSEATITIK